MYRRVLGLPVQLGEGWRLDRDLELDHEFRGIDSIALAGMGGSAIGGSLLAAYGADQIPIPFLVQRGYALPAFVGKKTLVIAANYSGGTEETLSAFRAAHERGARLLAVTTGGEVGSLADAWGVPCVRFTYDAQPRATLGYLFTPLLAIFERLGLLPPQDGAVREHHHRPIVCRELEARKPLGFQRREAARGQVAGAAGGGLRRRVPG
jgi:glucose/mannose-6-phosphate isomerase